MSLTSVYQPKNIIWLTSCHSTNLVLNEKYNNSEIETPIIIATHEQTAGVGQRNNKWITEKGKNLTFSIGFPLKNFSSENQFRITIATSIAIFDTLSYFFTKETIKIKWPNDILINDSKICGILIENKVRGNDIIFSIIGIGLNVNQIDFGYLNATSFKKIKQIDFDLDKILDMIVENFIKNIEDITISKFESQKSKYLKNLYKFNEPHLFKIPDGNLFEGSIINVDENGLLVIANGEIEKKFNLKEIKF